VDRVIPRTGGLVQVNIAPGSENEISIRPHYFTGDVLRIRNTVVKSIPGTILNYFLSPIDNID